MANSIGRLGCWRIFRRGCKAASALEFALLIGLVLAAAAGAVTAFSEDVQVAIRTIGTDVASITPPASDPDD